MYKWGTFVYQNLGIRLDQFGESTGWFWGQWLVLGQPTLLGFGGLGILFRIRQPY